MKKLTGITSLLQNMAQDINSLETRSLRERMARHKAISDSLKQGVDSDSDDYEEEFRRKQASKVEQEIMDAEKVKLHREF